MSTFEIVRGVDGDCLVLDGTRICGPKPWGGGRIINTFRTDGIYEAIDKDECRKLKADNDKLRKLAVGMYGMLEMVDKMLGNHDACETPRPLIFGEDKSFKDVMRELSVEVDE